ncbi:hypothetical protein SAMN07250955_11562 [Arboricoccus pini]|uniref:FAD dependent oxidoreductase n=1 Tax=Arboricoccus pini TaxID=1963835 RepID=A0A212RVR3_9PROT|nr:hypothetical protein [Arboricoccus pini]SNB76721.1 hypothetical protein SAMN07250955_11562 [Arboricoccus pini]
MGLDSVWRAPLEPPLWHATAMAPPATTLRLERETSVRVCMAGAGCSARGVPTGTMMGTVLADWAQSVPAADMAMRSEPTLRASGFMSVAPRAYLAWSRLVDGLAARRAGLKAPPF